MVSYSQRDSTINGIKCHLIAASDTGSSWIQQKVKTKKGEQFRGHYFEIFPDGKLKATGYYKKGKRNEKWIRYYKSGQKAEEGYFDAGYKSDLWKEYFPSGQLAWKGNFFRDIRSGFWRYYYENGVQKSMTRYVITTSRVMSKSKSKENGRSIKANMEIQYTISPADSLVEYYPDGKLKIRISYGHKGGLNGVCDYYYGNGVKSFHGEYLNGKKFGIWKYFCADGMEMRWINYDQNEQGIFEARVFEPEYKCGYYEIVPLMKWEIETFSAVKSNRWF